MDVCLHKLGISEMFACDL